MPAARKAAPVVDVSRLAQLYFHWLAACARYPRSGFFRDNARTAANRIIWSGTDPVGLALSERAIDDFA